MSSNQVLFEVILLLLAVPALALLARWLHPLLAMLAVAAAYGVLSDMQSAQIADMLGLGFAQTTMRVGLVILAGSLIAVVADATGAARRLGPAGLTMLGGVTGIGASAPAAFALLAPLAGTRGAGRAGALALALNAGHSLLWPSPVLVAAAAIVAAPWAWVLAFGLIVAVPVVVLGWRTATALSGDPPDSTGPGPMPQGSPLPLYAAIAAAVILVGISSLGHFPSEPFGGGATRALLLAAGHPVFLLAVVTVVLLALARRRESGALGDGGWFASAILRAAPIMLLAGLAGGFAKLLQTIGTPELAAEHLLALPLGVLVPFLAAAAIRSLGGSALIAAIAAAGMVEPLLPTLGLGSGAGRALAAVALGAGSFVVLHVNDPLFWQARAAGSLSVARALRLLTLGSLAQGVLAAVLLSVLALFVA